MAIKEYKYVNKHNKKDGTVSEYTVIIRYETKDQLSDEIKDQIREKINQGVTKTRICNDYNISFHKLNKILVH